MQCYAGGPLSERNGDKLAAAGVKLYGVYGATETGSLTCILDAEECAEDGAEVKTTADWAWMTFFENVKVRWAPEGDGTYELHVLVSHLL